MQRLDGILHAVAGKDIVLTLIGESGTGKEVLARRAHELSPRRAAPFIPINSAAIPDALFESELFGHERGAFTGATERTKGKIEAAEGGTLFLDEIGEMPLATQVKLLRFLESRRYMRVGGHTKLTADVRLVCATLRPLEDDVRVGRFRADLFYRIQGITLRVPPLRERRADIPLLVEQFVAQAAAKHGVAPPRLSRPVRSMLGKYQWPGNIRELRNVIEMVCLLRAGRTAYVDDLPPSMTGAAQTYEALESDQTKFGVSLAESLDAIVDHVIEAVLREERGNRTRTAQRLGISVRTVQRHMGASPRETSKRSKPAARRPSRQT
jgi:DNA-binding NtrC family response regulator